MVKNNLRVLIISSVVAVLLWVVDSFIDSASFSLKSFFDSLILNTPNHEIYFRLILVLCVLAGGAAIGKSLADRKKVQIELRQALERLEEEKARSEAIIAAIGDGISIQDTEMKVLYQNEVHKQIVGGDKTGEYCYRAYSHTESICPGCPVVLSLADGRIHTFERKRAGSDSQYLEIKSSPLLDAAGRIVAGIETVRDVTERKNAVEKLRLFSQAIEEAMDGIQIVDLNGNVLYSNRAVEEIYGFTPDELLGRSVNDMNADKEFAMRVILPELQEAGRWSGEVQVLHKDGRIFPIWLATAMVKDLSGRPVAMIGIIRDITERKDAEAILKRHREHLVKLVEERTTELRQTNEKLRREMADRQLMEEELLKVHKLESLGILAGGIAHDFNNLLASMLGNISLAMLDVDHDHPAFRQLVAAEKASLRAQDLTRQLLTFSKGGAPVKKTTRLGDLVKEAVGFALTGSRIRSEITVDDGLSLVDVDEGQISQVLHNLVINADHAMPGGGIVSIRCCNVMVDSQSLPLEEGLYVMVAIEDHGVGIPRDHLGKIFDPYFTTKQKGSGLGLATSYSIIRKHGGHISVESTLGVGTTFRIYLPVSVHADVQPASEERWIRKGTGSILVMDDEADVRETTGNILKRLGYSVAYAVDGEQAIELYRSARQAGASFDLVIMDLTVPGGMGGKEAIRRLIEIDPSVRAIVSSGYSNDPIMADFALHGFAGVVTKPFRLANLSEEVFKVLGSQPT